VVAAAIATNAIGALRPSIFFCCEELPVFGSPGVLLEVVLFSGNPDDVDAVAQPGTVLMVSTVVETVPPKARARPVQVTVLPIVMPEASMSVPRKVEFAPSVVAAVGVHQTLQALAPLMEVTIELAEVVSAPSILNMYVPAPSSVIVPPPPTEAAPVIQ
jgi:hypothetical protein